MNSVRITVRIFRSETGASIDVPALVTDQGLLKPLIDYFADHVHARSHSWMVSRIQVIELLLNFVSVNNDGLDHPKKIFKVFVQQLYSGTIGDKGLDPSGLYWKPKRINTANRLINALINFFEWFADQSAFKPPFTIGEASSYEQILNWAAYNQKHYRAFLAHTWDKSKASANNNLSRRIVLRKSISGYHDPVKHFPDSRFNELLFRGFINPGSEFNSHFNKRINIRDTLITLLLHGGGLRQCEPFHLYFDDVTLDTVLSDHLSREIALVRIYHPSEGMIPQQAVTQSNNFTLYDNREHYLKLQFGMKPRTQYISESMRSGWKINHLDNQRDKYIQIYWYPRIYGIIFYKMWKIYLAHLRTLKVKIDHPFAFVTLAGKCKGKPLSISAYRQNHKAAVKRIGLTPSNNY